MPKRPWCFLLVALLFSSDIATAADSLSRYEERKLYERALRAIGGGQSAEFRRLRAQLGAYPLLPYLDYAELIRNISRQGHDAIDNFRSVHGAIPPYQQLVRSWLSQLARRGRWQDLVTYFQADYSTRELDCHYAYGLYRLGRTTEAFSRATELWNVGYSQPDACDPLFHAWSSDAPPDHDLAWQRFTKALQNRERSLASYLTRFMDRGDRTLAQNFVQASRRPVLIGQRSRYAADTPYSRELILHHISRLGAYDANLAVEHLSGYMDSHGFSEQQLAMTYRDIVIQACSQPGTEELLRELPLEIEGDNALIEALIRFHMKQQAWGQILVYINLLDDEEKNTSRWRYWWARILDMGADERDRQTAREVFAELALSRDFYGFLSADRLKVPYALENLPAAVSDAELERIESLPAMQRAIELLSLGHMTSARREWNYAITDMTPDQLEVAAKVAQKWGWHEKSIQGMIVAERWNDLRIRFPLAYQDLFMANARVQDIPINWSLAIARQESAFMWDVRSPAGARGIMQLMPATASQTARKHDIDYGSESDLNSPDINIALGSAYLGEMLRRFDNNRVLASAAYNAGPQRVADWIQSALPVDAWIETIPFRETRGYVQNVLAFAVIYSYRLDDHRPFIADHERAWFEPRQISEGDGAAVDDIAPEA